MQNCFFPNQIEPVLDATDPSSKEAYIAYWKKEKERCINGFYLADNQVFISGHLYFHCVYWKIAAYIVNERTGKKARKIITPLLRDLDWIIINEDFEDCEKLGKFYALVGSRDFGKSILAASRAGWLYTFFNQSESVITAGQSTHIKLSTDKIEDGLSNMHPIFKKKRLANDWKIEVRAGWKLKKSNMPDPRSSNSVIIMRNYENGVKTMAANGTRPGFHLIDEIGTIPNLISCIKDSDGCWWSGEGDKPSCLPMFTGTGGDMEVGKEAAEIFYRPAAYNILEKDNVWEISGKIGRFIPATMAKLAFKEKKPLSEFLGISHPDLDVIEILVSNEERALKEWWEPAYAKALSSNNPKTVLKFKAYWPLVPSDAFLRLSHNAFNIEEAKRQQAFIRDKKLTGISVDLKYDGGNVVHEINNRVPISEFPLKVDDDEIKKSTVVCYEFPPPSPAYGLYVAGVDPYKQDGAKYSESLGSIYIFKRLHDITGEGYQDMIVAHYTGRPKSIDEWCETARKLIKYYNALTLAENEDIYFIKYMINKGDGHYLVDQPKWLIDNAGISNSSVNREKGIHAVPKIISFLDNVLKQYTEEVKTVKRDDNGSVIEEITNMRYIFDPMLLEEIIQFSKDGNFDRVRAVSLAIALARHLDRSVKARSIDDSGSYNRVKKIIEERKPSQMFKNSRKNFAKIKKLFR